MSVAAKPLEVLLADDHPLFRKGLAALLSLDKRVEVVSEASDGLQVEESVEHHSPDVVMMDVHMPMCGGIDAVRRLRATGYSGGIVMLTVSDDLADVFAAIEAGANGYLVKNAAPEELVPAILEAAAGGTVFSRTLTPQLVAALGRGNREPPSIAVGDPLAAGALSEREREVLALVSEGATNSEIGEALYLSENTVKTHVRNIIAKLGVKNRSQAAAHFVGTRHETVGFRQCRSGLAQTSEGIDPTG